MQLAHAKAKITTLIVFALLCLGIFMYLYSAAGGRLPFSSRYTVNAVIGDTLNLIPNSDVRAAGVKVGEVDAVVPDGQNALVTFSIDTKTGSFPPIFRNATTQVRTKTLVGESYLSLDPGTPSAGILRNGGTLPLSNWEPSVTLDDVLGMFDPKTRQAVRADMAGLGQGLTGHGAQLNYLFGTLKPFVDNGDALFSALLPEREDVASLINDSGQVMEALGERTAEYQSLIVDARQTAVAVASRADELRTTFDDLPSTLNQARQTLVSLNGFSQQATPVFSDLRVASADLSPAIAELAPTAADARVLFRRLRPFLNAVQPLFAQLKPAAAKLGQLVPPLDAVLRQADPALAYLSPYAQDFGSFFANVGAAFGSSDSLGAHAAVDAVVSPAAFDDLNATERSVLDSFLKAGGETGTLTNAYPMPDTAGRPGAADNDASVPAAP